jgi:hypothetical protein
LSIVCKNLLNSMARWRLCSDSMTLPLAVSSAATAARAVARVVVGGPGRRDARADRRLPGRAHLLPIAALERRHGRRARVEDRIRAAKDPWHDMVRVPVRPHLYCLLNEPMTVSGET